MGTKKLQKKRYRKKKSVENHKFNKTMLISFSIVFLFITILLILIYWCDFQFNYRKMTLYGKEVPKNLVCMVHDNMQHHESSKIEFNNKLFFVCSHDCHLHLTDYYQDDAFALDAYSGDTICKASALIGLQEKSKPNLIYFKN